MTTLIDILGMRRTFISLVTGIAFVAISGVQPVAAETKYRRIPTQYIAALADPGANSGAGAETWGLWRVDPGPRGVRLRHFESLVAMGGVAPAQWQFDSRDWWLDENGLIMERPQFPLPPGKYVVTGGREMTTVLTIHARDENGAQRWELGDGASIYDVTHLKCRSARYTPGTGPRLCSPAQAQLAAFPVAPGGSMPPVDGCNKQDYSVLLVIGISAGD